MKAKSKQVKMKNYKQQHEKCEICGHYATTVHHILPVALGGENEDYNFIALCEECHGKAHKYGISKNYLYKYARAQKGKMLNHIGLLKYIQLQTYETSVNSADIVGLINKYADMSNEEREKVNEEYEMEFEQGSDEE